MKPLVLVLSIVATLGVWAADFLLLGVPAFRNGWWTLTLFAVPAALLLLGSRGEGAKKTCVAAWIVFILGAGGYAAMRKWTGSIKDEPVAVVGGQTPDFTLKDQDGKDVAFKDLRSAGKVVLVFFRGKG